MDNIDWRQADIIFSSAVVLVKVRCYKTELWDILAVSFSHSTGENKLRSTIPGSYSKILRGKVKGILRENKNMYYMWVGSLLTCMSGRLCTQGIATLPSLEESQPYPGTSHGNADHNWCKRVGLVIPLGYHIARNLYHLQLWIGKKRMNQEKNGTNEVKQNIFPQKH